MMPTFPTHRLLPALILLLAVLAPVRAAPGTGLPLPVPEETAAPAATGWDWEEQRTLAQLGLRQDVLLSGVSTITAFDFPVRRDRVVREAWLDLAFTPSPSLLPAVSHLRVYLNDALMDVVPIGGGTPGRPARVRVPLDARLAGDYNQVRLEFIGHYTDICEEPTHSSLWVNLSRDSRLRLAGQTLAVRDDLATFPLPFFDPRDAGPLAVPVVLAGPPGPGQQQAAAVLASYFGSLAGWWRPARFPVLYDRLPDSGHAVVLATNARRPSFLRDTAPATGPVIELVPVPGDPRRKLLLLLGRDDADLQKAVRALAAGSVLLRGDRVRVEEVPPLAPRRPYDAPNWVPTDRPVRLGDLVGDTDRLQVNGLAPPPVRVDLNLPPDLFVWRSRGIPLQLRYRYTPPVASDESRLLVRVNDRLVASYPLQRDGVREDVRGLDLPAASLAGAGGMNLALRIGGRHQLRFDFSFASVVASAQKDRCQTTLPPSLQGVVSEDSTLDFSGLPHYLAMPDLAAFAVSGFPFTRMADLSETVAVMPARPTPAQLGLLLEVMAGLGAQSGHPAHGLRVSADWERASREDADLLVLGPLPADLRGHPALALQVAGQRTALRGDGAAAVDVSAAAPFAAVVGLQAPHHAQRSIVALIAQEAADYVLLSDALASPGGREAISGSVAILRTAGIHSQFVGKPYYVGHLPWWRLLWFRLAGHPLLVGLLALLAAAVLAFLAWAALRGLARRRLAGGGP